MIKKIVKNKYLLPFVNIIVPIILFIIVLFSELSDNMMYVIIMTVMVGWLIPYIVLLVSGISMLRGLKEKLILVFNILNVLVCLMNITLSVVLYDHKMLIIIVEYVVIMIISIVNVLVLFNKFKILQREKRKILKKENNILKEEKNKNNGALV